MTSIVLNQTIVMLILMIAGVICRKTGIISENSNRELSSFVLKFVNPVMVFMSYQTEYDSRLVKNLLICFAISAILFLVAIVLSYVLIRDKKGRETEIERFSAIYSNCGFMGIPLVKAMFGMEGVFYLTAFITVFNLVVWTHGIILISGEKNFRQVVKVFYSPVIISIALGLVFFFCRITLPEIVSRSLEYISELNTPLAMIVSGITMAGTNLKDLVKNFNIYRVCAIKLIIIPVIAVLALSPFDMDEKVRLTAIVALSAPPAAMCTLQCIRYGKNSLYASEIFTAGTILSVITLPIITRLTEYLTKTLV